MVVGGGAITQPSVHVLRADVHAADVLQRKDELITIVPNFSLPPKAFAKMRIILSNVDSGQGACPICHLLPPCCSLDVRAS
jgi:hypothetical protein